MTELELRELVADTAIEYLGCNEADGSHRVIIDTYNKILPLPRGYKMSYTDPWCAAYVSAVGAECGLGDIILPECSCDAMINLYKARGLWAEADNYKPRIGDIVMYDWGDSGSGDNTGGADHVGIIYATDGNKLTVIEGNKNDSVDFRSLNINGRYIRGYCLPDYASAGGTVTKDVIALNASESSVALFVRELKKDTIGEDVAAMQALLELNKCSCGRYGVDREFGADTESAVIKFQGKMGLKQDGICGANTWSALLGY